MKFSSLFLLAALCAMTAFVSCKSDGQAARDAAVENAAGTTGDAAANPIPPMNEPPQNAEGVWHYTCPNGCEGGAGSAVPCPKCGTTLAHNSAYHANAPAVDATPISPTGTTELNPITPPTPTAEPAQNAAGVWHYTCPNGCAGGGGSAVACSKCGTTLAHNSAYHQ